MNTNKILRLIKKDTKAKVLVNESLVKHTSLRIGGKAKLLVIPKSIKDLKVIIHIIKTNRIPYFVIGAGSNILFPDKGFPGIIIKMARGLDGIMIQGSIVKVGSGIMLSTLMKLLAQKGLHGLEFAAGVPATIGGAAAMNLGAYGSEMANFINSVKVMNLNGREKILTKRALNFGYRTSSLWNGKHIITEVTLKLKKGKSKNIRKKINRLLNLRRNSQPISTPNAGSVFKNPNGFYAAKLIEDCGAKGMRIGDAQISKKHANFIINLGAAKAKDVLEIIRKVKKLIYSKSNINLEPEIKIVSI